MNRANTFLLIGFVLILFGLNILINAKILDTLFTTKDIIKIHIFVSLLTIVVINTLSFIQKRFPDKVGFGFLAFVLVKMLLAVIFLMPFIKNNQPNLKSFIIQFFIVFFSHLFFEVIITLKLLKKN